MRFLSNFILNRHPKSFIIFTVLLSFTIFGCAGPKVQMYPGDKVDSSKQAVIRVEDDPKPLDAEYKQPDKYFELSFKDYPCTTRIFSVDKARTMNLLTLSFYGGAAEVYVLPGKHILFLAIESGGLIARPHLWLIAEPGGKYIIKAVSKGRSFWAWIENEQTGKRVGGILGSDDEPKS